METAVLADSVPPANVTTSPALTDLRNSIRENLNRHDALATDCVRRFIDVCENAIRSGWLIADARDIVVADGGRWGEWVSKNLNISLDRARRLRRLSGFFYPDLSEHQRRRLSGLPTSGSRGDIGLHLRTQISDSGAKSANALWRLCGLKSGSATQPSGRRRLPARSTSSDNEGSAALVAIPEHMDHGREGDAVIPDHMDGDIVIPDHMDGDIVIPDHMDGDDRYDGRDQNAPARSLPPSGTRLALSEGRDSHAGITRVCEPPTGSRNGTDEPVETLSESLKKVGDCLARIDFCEVDPAKRREILGLVYPVIRCFTRLQSL
jgi:hypothetical protein